MKLIYCTECNDVFKLILGKMRFCECKQTYGRYTDNLIAEVSDTAISLAIGNGSLKNAIIDMIRLKHTSENKADRDQYYEDNKGKISYAWVRPNEGLGNPHCKVIYSPK